MSRVNVSESLKAAGLTLSLAAEQYARLQEPEELLQSSHRRLTFQQALSSVVRSLCSGLRRLHLQVRPAMRRPERSKAPVDQ